MGRLAKQPGENVVEILRSRMRFVIYQAPVASIWETEDAHTAYETLTLQSLS